MFYVLFCTYAFAYEKAYDEKSNWNLFKHGFICSSISLICQEIFGHYMGGDDPSRFEAIPNAVMYATYFQQIIYLFEKKLIFIWCN